MTKTITITDLAQVRDGDTCTVEIRGRQYTGPAYAGEGDSLVWAGYLLRRRNGDPSAIVTFISATRTAPSLPTMGGSVILVHEAGSKVYDPPVLAVHDGTTVIPWMVVPANIGHDNWFGDEDITSWQECDATPRGEVIRRPTVRAVREAVGDA